jgi:N6-L-threonylcarbamoyladenine synthase
MKILSIETSCDETAVSIIEASGGLEKPTFNVLSNLVLSQVNIHTQYGGVFPNLAKREHAKNLVPLVKKALEEAKLLSEKNHKLGAHDIEKIKNDLVHEPDLFTAIVDFLSENGKPDIDLIAVTYGPGLEPALWVGINAAKILGFAWGVPVMPVNHMEGHICSVLAGQNDSVLNFPALALLISGGHTELVLISEWLKHKVVGQTRDDAVGEAYDKVARMMGLQYPGGPQIAAFAKELRELGQKSRFEFPRPMIHSNNLDFSFSGLKTAVLYEIRKILAIGLVDSTTVAGATLPTEIKKEIALAFEDAVVETLVVKTSQAIDTYKPQTLVIAGGVIANTTIRQTFESLIRELGVASNIKISLLVPGRELATDNALMIALAAYIRFMKNPDAAKTNESLAEIRAEGNVQLGELLG